MKKLQRITALLCAAVTVLSLCASATVAGAAEDKEARKKAMEAANAKKTEINQQISAKKEELSKAKDELNRAKANTADAKGKKDAAEQQITLLSQEIGLLEEKIEVTRGQIQLTMENIDAVTEAEKEQYGLFCSQARQEEERGSISYWSVLFRASSFADLLSRIDFINEIADYNRQVIAGLQSIRAELKEQQAELEEREAELEAEQAELEEARSEQETLAEEYAQLYKDYQQTEAGLEAAYQQAVAEEAALEAAMREVEMLIQQLGISGSGSSGGYIWPVSVSPKYITSKFGPRQRPTAGASTLHNGIDIGVSYVPVYAAKSGTVVVAGRQGGFGECVIISHGVGFTTTYGHLSSYNCKVGDVVVQGQQIAVSGNTGVSTGPHLDFRIMENGSYVDPLNYLSGYTLLC